MELVDVVDSKSTGSDTVPVRVRPPAPKIPILLTECRDFFVTVRTRISNKPPLQQYASGSCIAPKANCRWQFAVAPPLPSAESGHRHHESLQCVALEGFNDIRSPRSRMICPMGMISATQMIYAYAYKRNGYIKIGPL